MNDLQIMNISGVDCYEKDGVAYLKLENVARGLGFTTVATSGNEVVRWNTVHGYLKALGVATSCNGTTYKEACPNYIPENIFYRLAMKAKNPVAEAFQAKVADEIIPSIRKHGAYMTEKTLEEAILNPDYLLKLAQALKDETDKRKALESKTKVQEQIIMELKPRADYTDRILHNKGLVTITQIAKDYGMSGKTMNALLNNLCIQYKSASGQWLLYAKYQDKGYTHSKTIDIVRSDGRSDIVMETKWTQKGRLFLYEKLKTAGLLPMIEREA